MRVSWYLHLDVLGFDEVIGECGPNLYRSGRSLNLVLRNSLPHPLQDSFKRRKNIFYEFKTDEAYKCC